MRRIQYCSRLLFKSLYMSQSGRFVLLNTIQATFLGNVQSCSKYSAEAMRSHNTYTRYIHSSVYSMNTCRLCIICICMFLFTRPLLRLYAVVYRYRLQLLIFTKFDNPVSLFTSYILGVFPSDVNNNLLTFQC